ncbi:MAG: hypothetical protein HQM02_13935, partial [Magnetococcales bacterium]|nr:hypothetical protein [Magnetococcales bacterium]
MKTVRAPLPGTRKTRLHGLMSVCALLVATGIGMGCAKTPPPADPALSGKETEEKRLAERDSIPGTVKVSP